MGNKNISMAVIRRLPKYYRYLADLLSKDVQRISSKELSEIIGFTASQIRQDLNNFGGFGQQGYGYNVEALHREIGKILGLDRKYRAILIGAGNLGQALTNYTGFRLAGFETIAVFDAKSTNGNNSALLAELTQKTRLNGLRIDQSALVFTQNGRTQFFGDKNLVDFLSTNWYPQWTHTLTV